MNKKALINISSNGSMTADEPIEVISPGTYKIEDGNYVAEYDETEISGMKGTKTKVTVGRDFLKLERTGSTSTKMYFKKNESDVSLYNTPYGILEIKIDTQDLKIDMSENGGEVKIKYSMEVNDQPPLKTNLVMNIKTTN